MLIVHVKYINSTVIDIQFVLNLGSGNAENNADYFHDEQPVILDSLV